MIFGPLVIEQHPELIVNTQDIPTNDFVIDKQFKLRLHMAGQMKMFLICYGGIHFSFFWASLPGNSKAQL